MTNICDFCLNYESDIESDYKTREFCSQACFYMDDDEGEMVCKNFALVICPCLSSAIVERFIKRDANFYETLCDLTSLILTIFSYQTIFKIKFDIEHGSVELFDLTTSHTYGNFKLNSIELEKGFVTFETDYEFRTIISSIIEPTSLIFVEFEDFENDKVIRGVFTKLNRFINRNKITLLIQEFSGLEVW